VWGAGKCREEEPDAHKLMICVQNVAARSTSFFIRFENLPMLAYANYSCVVLPGEGSKLMGVESRNNNVAPGKTISFFISAFPTQVGIFEGNVLVSREEGGEAIQSIPVLLNIVDAAKASNRPVLQNSATMQRTNLLQSIPAPSTRTAGEPSPHPLPPFLTASVTPCPTPKVKTPRQDVFAPRSNLLPTTLPPEYHPGSDGLPTPPSSPLPPPSTRPSTAVVLPKPASQPLLPPPPMKASGGGGYALGYASGLGGGSGGYAGGYVGYMTGDGRSGGADVGLGGGHAGGGSALEVAAAVQGVRGLTDTAKSAVQQMQRQYDVDTAAVHANEKIEQAMVLGQSYAAAQADSQTSSRSANSNVRVTYSPRTLITNVSHSSISGAKPAYGGSPRGKPVYRPDTANPIAAADSAATKSSAAAGLATTPTACKYAQVAARYREVVSVSQGFATAALAEAEEAAQTVRPATAARQESQKFSL